MPKQLVFVDDSGNPGFKGTSSSSVLVISGILITDSKVTSQINVEINKFPNSLGWQELHEFKFRKASKNIKLQFLELINKYDFSIYAVYIDKTNYPELFQFSNDEKLYNWMVKELLLIMPLNKAVVIIDGKYGKKYQLRFKSYIRKSLNTNSKKIENFKAKDSARDNLVQLADIIAGSINRSLQNNKTDRTDYIRIIKRKIIKLEKLNLNKNS